MKNEEPEEDYKIEVDLMEHLHSMRMQKHKVGTEEEEVLTKSDFNEVIDKLKKGGKVSYNFITKAGQNFKDFVFKICQIIWESEEIPDQWNWTTLIALFKGKGSKHDLNFFRFIHTKMWLPRLFEGLVVKKMKPKLIRSMTQFQIGGKAGHRSAEHIFVVKSMMALYSLLDIVIIIQFFDIQKFFDKERLRDGMNTIYEAGLRGKVFRLWYNLNSNTSIKVQTGVGCFEYKFVGELIGQGTCGGAMVSAANLDLGVEEAFKGSDQEVAYGPLRIQPVIDFPR